MKHIPLIALSALTLCSSALAQTETQTTPACALLEPDSPRQTGLGTIIGFQDPSMARADIPYREAQRGGAIDTHYLGDLRVVVRQDNGWVDVFDVPAGASVHSGERVKLQGSYRSTAFPCSYIPHMAIPDDVPGV